VFVAVSWIESSARRGVDVKVTDKQRARNRFMKMFMAHKLSFLQPKWRFFHFSYRERICMKVAEDNFDFSQFGVSSKKM